MKRQVQLPGIRKWFGDDFVQIQDEIYIALESFFEQYGSCIISGCSINSGTIAPGVVALEGEIDGKKIFKVVQFDGASGQTWPKYMALTRTIYNREYDDGIVKDIIHEYKAVLQSSPPAHGYYLTINSTGNRTFRDAIQNSTYRFATDSEKTTWNAARAGAVSDVRGGVASDKDTLQKLVTWAQGLCDLKVALTALANTTQASAGAKLVGVYDDFTNSNSTLLQNVLKDFDTALNAKVALLALSAYTPESSGDLLVGTDLSNFEFVTGATNLYGTLHKIDSLITVMKQAAQPATILARTTNGTHNVSNGTQLVTIEYTQANETGDIVVLPTPSENNKGVIINIKLTVTGSYEYYFYIKYGLTTIYQTTTKRKNVLVRSTGSEWYVISANL